MEEDDSKYLSPDQLAKRWHMSARTLSNWRQEGKGPPYSSPGGKAVYERSVIEEYENDSRK